LLYVLLGLLVVALVLVVGTLSLFAPHHDGDDGVPGARHRGLSEGSEIIGRSS